MSFAKKVKSETSTLDINYGSMLWYLKEVCGGMDRHDFDDHKKARSFGHNVRQNCPEIDVEINATVVRLKLKLPK